MTGRLPSTATLARQGPVADEAYDCALSGSTRNSANRPCIATRTKCGFLKQTPWSAFGTWKNAYTKKKHYPHSVHKLVKNKYISTQIS
jgi:hypothetical protein